MESGIQEEEREWKKEWKQFFEEPNVSIDTRKSERTFLKNSFGFFIVLCFTSILFYWAFTLGRDYTRAEAVNARVGVWTCDPISGEVKFRFCVP